MKILFEDELDIKSIPSLAEDLMEFIARYDM